MPEEIIRILHIKSAIFIHRISISPQPKCVQNFSLLGSPVLQPISCFWFNTKSIPVFLASC